LADATKTTTDTALASYLITEGYQIVNIDYSQLRYEYTFDRPISEHSSKYISGNALTDPSDFSRVNKKLIRVISKRVQWEDD